MDSTIVKSCSSVRRKTTGKASISTTPGDGAVVGPLAKSAADGWLFADKMIQIEVNGTKHWIATYVEDPYP
jgi:hypothetical protein